MINLTAGVALTREVEEFNAHMLAYDRLIDVLNVLAVSTIIFVLILTIAGFMDDREGANDIYFNIGFGAFIMYLLSSLIIFVTINAI